MPDRVYLAFSFFSFSHHGFLLSNYSLVEFCILFVKIIIPGILEISGINCKCGYVC